MRQSDRMLLKSEQTHLSPVEQHLRSRKKANDDNAEDGTQKRNQTLPKVSQQLNYRAKNKKKERGKKKQSQSEIVIEIKPRLVSIAEP